MWVFILFEVDVGIDIGHCELLSVLIATLKTGILRADLEKFGK